VKILLPPSEGKSAPSGGGPVEPDSLVFHESLGHSRGRLIGELAKLADRPRDEAVEVMAISPGQAGEISRNAVITSSPAGPAAEVYSGVLYDRLDFGSLGPKASDVAAERILIASALWGFLRSGDRIPYYRLSMKARLPGIPGLAEYWRDPLAAAMEGSGHDREGDLILDMRSGAYSAAWKPKRARLLTVRAFTEQDGERKAVSHMAKAVRGEVARSVLSAPALPEDADSVAALLERSGMRVELSERFLDVIEDG
jgi:cytoplasmic iron level regulating protein YaaA (DUF328/UPF0246 family)